MFRELSLAESDCTSSQLRLDKKKLQMNDRRSSKDKKTNQEVKNSCWPWLVQIAAGRKIVLLEKVQTWGWDPSIIQNYNPWAIHVATPITWILRAAQEPDSVWSLKRCANWCCDPNSWTSPFHNYFVHEHLKSYHQTLSGKYPLQTMNPHDDGSGWTKGNRKMNDRRASTDQKKQSKSWTSCWPWLVQIAAGRTKSIVWKDQTWSAGPSPEAVLNQL